jgi:hypothetical protein
MVLWGSEYCRRAYPSLCVPSPPARPYTESLVSKNVSGSDILHLVSGMYILPGVVRLFNNQRTSEVGVFPMPCWSCASPEECGALFLPALTFPADDCRPHAVTCFMHLALCACVLQDLHVHGGSGKFTFSFNDSTRITPVTGADSRTLEVFPVTPGSVLVTATDTQLPVPETASALVIVSLISRIVISIRSQVLFALVGWGGVGGGGRGGRRAAHCRCFCFRSPGC